jgi:hypothetical protein
LLSGTPKERLQPMIFLMRKQKFSMLYKLHRGLLHIQVRQIGPLMEWLLRTCNYEKLPQGHRERQLFSLRMLRTEIPVRLLTLLPIGRQTPKSKPGLLNYYAV